MYAVLTFRKFAALITAVAAFGLLFVVLCPITATPVAVVSSHSPHVFGFGLAAVATLAVQTILLALPGAQLAARQAEGQPSRTCAERLIDLTCARLC
jgi:hypothetical protein